MPATRPPPLAVSFGRLLWGCCVCLTHAVGLGRQVDKRAVVFHCTHLGSRIILLWGQNIRVEGTKLATPERHLFLWKSTRVICAHFSHIISRFLFQDVEVRAISIVPVSYYLVPVLPSPLESASSYLSFLGRKAIQPPHSGAQVWRALGAVRASTPACTLLLALGPGT